MGGGGGGKGGGGSTTTVQKADPWEGQQPYLVGKGSERKLKPGAVGTTYTDPETGEKATRYSDDDYYWTSGTPGVFPEAARLYTSGGLAPEYYSGQTVSDLSGYTRQALQMQADRAMNGDAGINAARQAMQDIEDGTALQNNSGLNTLNAMSSAVNPYSDALYNRANQQALSQINGNFSKAGRYGSGAHENAVADASQNLANQFYSNAYNQQLQAAQAAGQMYNQGIGQQIMGAGQAQNLGNQAYTDAAALSEAGGVLEDYQQELLNAAKDKYDYEAQRPLLALQNYNALVQGDYGGSSSSSTSGTTSRSRLGNVAGGAMAGAGLGSSFGPMGTLAGAIGGGLLGLF